MSKEELKRIESKEMVKPIKPEDVILVQPTKPMNFSEIQEEMKKQGMRPLTLDEMQNYIKRNEPFKIKPKETDIVIEGEKEEDRSKELPSL